MDFDSFENKIYEFKMNDCFTIRNGITYVGTPVSLHAIFKRLNTDYMERFAYLYELLSIRHIHDGRFAWSGLCSKFKMTFKLNVILILLNIAKHL